MVVTLLLSIVVVTNLPSNIVDGDYLFFIDLVGVLTFYLVNDFYIQDDIHEVVLIFD